MLPPRGTAALAAGGTVLLGLVLPALVGSWAGDALYTVLVWTLVLLAAPRTRPVVAAGLALAVSWAVEFAQLGPLPAELSRRSLAARLVLGSTFQATDLLWYAVGALVALLLHTAVRGSVRAGGRGRREREPAGFGGIGPAGSDQPAREP
ncbi:DUF2809 domain-containing protein [Streptacidiphilus sp. N1-12]|uniref:DUF2809 domain-containing protein n=2 Tax=Streptacidiphilus alkalitolerans TaxID=3342712 RepID=A0ABV6V7C5_9ACTN